MSTGRVLLAEDDEVIAMLIEDALTSVGHQVVIHEDGQAAWDHLQSGDTAFDVILTDRNMPRLDGLALLKQLKASPDLREIPVVMETGETHSASIQEGIDQGAHYYLTKPFKPDVLVAIVNAAINQYREYRQLQENVRSAVRPFAYLHHGAFRFSSVEEGRMLANFFAQTSPDPGKVVIGLQELLINAVEHGNLGLSYQDKSELLMQDRWHDEVEYRLTLPENLGRYVEIVFERLENALRFTIRDQGKGFDWEKYLDFDPARIFDTHGRGIAMARKLSFSTLEYQGNGNTVVATIDRP
jgi:CheY-like chemotaxis protein/anti-sigma regulatory factor (Ser/Thr protein kinase)